MADVLLQLKYDKSDITNNTVQKNAVTITALVDNCQIGIYSANSTSIKFKVSYDNGVSWSNIRLTDNNPYNLNILDEGESLLLCGDGNEAINHGLEGCHIYSKLGVGTNVGAYFSMSGNVLALIDDDIDSLIPVIESSGTSLRYCFSDMFSPFVLNNYHYVSGIKDASELIFPDINVPGYFYAWMFYGNKSLEHAPKTIYTGTRADGIYTCSGMFEGCWNLTDAPALPSSVSVGCYMTMFKDCKSLTTAPELPSRNLRERNAGTSCYESMFEGCTSLTTAPILPATTLSSSCYNSMFKGCTALTTAPYSLPAKNLTLQYSCYVSMFEGCTVLTTSPIIEAQVLESGSCNNMFKDCTLLNKITIKAEHNSGSYAMSLCLNNWVDNVASSGNFYQIKDVTYDIDSTSGIPVGWTKHEEEPEQQITYTVSLTPRPTDKGGVMKLGTGRSYYGVFRRNDTITITAQPIVGYHLEGWYNGSTLISSDAQYTFIITSDITYNAVFAKDPTYYDVVLNTSDINKGSVTGTGAYEEDTTVTITATAETGNTFVGWIDTSGNLMYQGSSISLTVTDDIELTAVFVSDSLLPYYSKYFTVESLEDNAALDIYLTTSRYLDHGASNVFIKVNDGDWHLITSGGYQVVDNHIKIPLNTGGKVSFRNMDFNTTNWIYPIRINSDKTFKAYGNIASLYEWHEGANTTDTVYEFKGWQNDGYLDYPYLHGYDSYSGIFLNSKLADASNLILPFINLTGGDIGYGVYQSMFEGCTSLTTAPELPAINLDISCYEHMFKGCTSLTTAPKLVAWKIGSVLDYDSHQPILDTGHCYESMFEGCTSLTTAPEIHTTNWFVSASLLNTTRDKIIVLDRNEYDSMFANCTSLNYVKCLGEPAGADLLPPAYSAGYVGDSWLYNVAVVGTFVLDTDSRYYIIGPGGIPEGWTVINVDDEETESD